MPKKIAKTLVLSDSDSDSGVVVQPPTVKDLTKLSNAPKKIEKLTVKGNSGTQAPGAFASIFSNHAKNLAKSKPKPTPTASTSQAKKLTPVKNVSNSNSTFEGVIIPVRRPSASPNKSSSKGKEKEVIVEKEAVVEKEVVSAEKEKEVDEEMEVETRATSVVTAPTSVEEEVEVEAEADAKGAAVVEDEEKMNVD